jgi:hypothetical protein
LREPRHVVGGAELADETGGVPRRAAGQLPPLEQHDIAPAEARQMVCRAATDDAAADDDDTRLGGKCLDHEFSASDSLVGFAAGFAAAFGSLSPVIGIVTAASLREKAGASRKAMKFCPL